jgi:hypothetical protein
MKLFIEMNIICILILFLFKIYFKGLEKGYIKEWLED